MLEPPSATPKLLALDDDPRVLRDLMNLAQPWLEACPMRDPQMTLKRVEEDRLVRALILGNVSGVTDRIGFLHSIQLVRQDVRRILLTDYADLTQIIGGLHSGAIHFVMEKPVKAKDFAAAVAPLCHPSAFTPARKVAG